MNGCHVKPEQFFNLIFGYYDRYSDVEYTSEAIAGVNNLYCDPVPADEVWVVQAIAGVNANKVVLVYLGVVVGGINVYALCTTMVATGQWVSITGQWVLKEGDKVVGVFGSCDVGNDLTLRCSGYKMKLRQ